LLALAEKFHIAPEWWLEHSPVWLAEARKQIMVTNRVTELRADASKLANDAREYAGKFSGGGTVKVVTGADV